MFSLYTISTQHPSHAATHEASLRSSMLRGLELGAVYGELADSSTCWATGAQVRGKVSEGVIFNGLRPNGDLDGNDFQLPCPDVDTKPDRFGLRRPYKRLD